MRQEAFKQDEECLSFSEELKALFDGLRREEQDQELQSGQTRNSDGDKPNEQ